MQFKRTSGYAHKLNTCLLNEKFEYIDLGINRKSLGFGLIKLNANQFNTEQFINHLSNVALFYALPSKRINELSNNGAYNEMVKEARSKFRDVKYNDGEGGELISYCINEDILNAPKILSKLKLKTNPNDYVKGADGIHLLKINEECYEIIFVESKMYQSLDQAIKEAFKSIDRFIDGDSQEFEITTLATNFQGEFDDMNEELFAKYIIPSKDPVKTNLAFSIFIGFEINHNIDTALDYDEFEIKLIEYVRKEIENSLKSISKYLEEERHRGYSFYIYLMPFQNIASFRKTIIENIKGTNE